MAVTVLEILGYIALFAVLRLIFHRLADGGRDRPMTLLVVGGGLAILGVILSGVDWAGLVENWRDITANVLVALAIASVVYGYSMLIGAARRRSGQRQSGQREAGRLEPGQREDDER